jgi:hypothetical protein
MIHENIDIKPFYPDLINPTPFNYKDPNQDQYQNEIPQKPLTKKELINQIIINRIKAINERNRIAQIKSTKLLFNNNNRHDIVINSTQNRKPLNRLFRF